MMNPEPGPPTAEKGIEARPPTNEAHPWPGVLVQRPIGWSGSCVELRDRAISRPWVRESQVPRRLERRSDAPDVGRSTAVFAKRKLNLRVDDAIRPERDRFAHGSRAA